MIVPPSIRVEQPFAALLAAPAVEFVLVVHDLADFGPVLGAEFEDDAADGLVFLNYK